MKSAPTKPKSIIYLKPSFLVEVNLRAALAGIETMLEYGMMEAWDEGVRKH